MGSQESGCLSGGHSFQEGKCFAIQVSKACRAAASEPRSQLGLVPRTGYSPLGTHTTTLSVPRAPRKGVQETQSCHLPSGLTQPKDSACTWMKWVPLDLPTPASRPTGGSSHFSFLSLPPP